MKTVLSLGLVWTALTGAAAWAQNPPAPIASPTVQPASGFQPVTTQGGALTWAKAPPEPEYSLTQDSLPRSVFPFYVGVGLGASLAGLGFGQADDPWLGPNGATWAQGYGRDYGGGLFVQLKVGKYLDDNLSAELDLNYSYFPLPQTYPGIPNSNYYSDELTLIPTLRYDLLASLDTPYLLAGGGVDFNGSVAPAGTQSENDSADGTSSSLTPDYSRLGSTNPVVTGGMGFIFNLLGGNFYVQAQCDYVFTDKGGFAYYPIVLGFMGGETHR